MKVAFFEPQYLWAVGLCTIPLVLHLLFRRRTTSLLFSTLRFFAPTVVRASRRRKLRHICLLVVRTMIVATLVMIFAQPFNTSDPFSIIGDPQLNVYAWVDRTTSMDYRIGQRSLLRRSLDLLDSLRNHLALGARIYLYDDIAASWVEYSSELAERFAAVRHGQRPLCQVLETFRSQHDGRRLLLILSDFQYAPDDAVGVAQAIERYVEEKQKTLPVCCVSMAPRHPWNYRIASAQIAPENPSMLIVEVRTFRRPLGALNIEAAYLCGMRIGKTSFSSRDTIQKIRIPISLDSSGSMAGVVSFDTDDPFPIDNIRYFSIRKDRSRRVLIVGEMMRSYPIALAFRSLGRGHWESVTLADWPTVDAFQLDSADLIVLNAVPQPTPTLRHFVAVGGGNGRGVIFAPSVDSLKQDFNHLVFSQILQTSRLLIRRFASGRTVILSDTLSALWSGFPQLRDQHVSVNGYCELPVKGIPLCRFDNNDVLALDVSLPHFNSRWIMLACEIGWSNENNLWESGFYVPLIDRLARRCLAGTSMSDEWFAGVSSPNPHYDNPYPANVYDARQRYIAVWGRQKCVVFDEPGCYQIRPYDASPYWLAVNPDTAESNLTYRLPAVKKDNSFILRDEKGFLNLIRQPAHQSMSRIIWLILALLILSEIFLCLPTFYRKRKTV